MITCIVVSTFLSFSPGGTSSQSARSPDNPLERAAALMRAGKMAEAEQTLQALLRVAPKDANALNLLGILRGEQDRTDEAEKVFHQALRLDPKLAGAAVNLGYLHRKTHRPEEALVAFTQADKIQPNDPEIRFNIASVQAELGQFRTALDILEKLPQRDRSPEYPLVLARCYIGLGRLDQLRTSFGEMRSVLEKFPRLAADFAQLLITSGLADDAIGFLEGIEEPAAGSFPVTFMLGEAYQLKGNGEKAAAFYRMALKSQPNSVETLKRLSSIAQEGEKWEEMFQYLSQAKNLAPNSGSVLYGFAVAALRTGHIGDAQYALHQALDLEPENADYLYLYGITQMSFSDIPPATETFRKYIQLRPQDARGYLGLASVLYESAQYEEALSALKQCGTLNPNFVEPIYYLGMIALNQGDLPRARQYLSEVIAREPKHAAAHSGLGAVYFKSSQFERAKEELELALKLKPDHATTHYQLSQVLVRLNETERAQEELKLYSEMKSKAEEARNAASRLLTSPGKP